GGLLEALPRMKFLVVCLKLVLNSSTIQKISVTLAKSIIAGFLFKYLIFRYLNVKRIPLYCKYLSLFINRTQVSSYAYDCLPCFTRTIFTSRLDAVCCAGRTGRLRSDT